MIGCSKFFRPIRHQCPPNHHFHSVEFLYCSVPCTETGIYALSCGFYSCYRMRNGKIINIANCFYPHAEQKQKSSSFLFILPNQIKTRLKRKRWRTSLLHLKRNFICQHVQFVRPRPQKRQTWDSIGDECERRVTCLCCRLHALQCIYIVYMVYVRVDPSRAVR